MNPIISWTSKLVENAAKFCCTSSFPSVAGDREVAGVLSSLHYRWWRGCKWRGWSHPSRCWGRRRRIPPERWSTCGCHLSSVAHRTRGKSWTVERPSLSTQCSWSVASRKGIKRLQRQKKIESKDSSNCKIHNSKIILPIYNIKINDIKQYHKYFISMYFITRICLYKQYIYISLHGRKIIYLNWKVTEDVHIIYKQFLTLSWKKMVRNPKSKSTISPTNRKPPIIVKSILNTGFTIWIIW